MTESSRNAGTIQVLAEQLERQELPRLLSIKEKVDAGEALGEFDIGSLNQVFKDANAIMVLPILSQQPLDEFVTSPVGTAVDAAGFCMG